MKAEARRDRVQRPVSTGEKVPCELRKFDTHSGYKVYARVDVWAANPKKIQFYYPPINKLESTGNCY